MNRRQFVPLLGAALMMSGCGWNDSSWNQKLTVTVDTPDGPKQGSAVTSIAWSENQIFKDGARWHLEMKGEAVVVDLGQGKFLFALLSNQNDQEIMGRMGPRSVGGFEGKGNEFKQHKEPIEVLPKYYPLLVTFDDLNDPKSVKEVSPADLAASFGAGFSLKSITLEITDEKVTKGAVEKVLGWIVGYKGRIKSPDLRLGSGLHNASDVLPIEKLDRLNFIEGAQ